jgi:hypothetical protein
VLLLLSVEAWLLIRYLLTNVKLLTHGHVNGREVRFLAETRRALRKRNSIMSQATMPVSQLRCVCQADIVRTFLATIRLKPSYLPRLRRGVESKRQCVARSANANRPTTV